MDDLRSLDQPAAVRLNYLHLKNFRCFENFEVHLEAPSILFAGANGVGKTSLLEALYYTCYLRSFRTHSPKELISFGKQDFFVKVTVDMKAHALPHTIQVGFAPHKRLVKVDQKAIVSYKELMSYYRIVSVTESDLDLVQDSPASRRLFVDQALLFLEESYGMMLKDYRRIVDQRNALLQQRSVNPDTYTILTEQLWRLAISIEARRKELLDTLIVGINTQRMRLFPQLAPLEFTYVAKRPLGSSYEEFIGRNKGLFEQEQRFGRTLFGAHLDDIHIMFQGQLARLFASRGQQKLIVILIKMAHLELLLQRGIPAICLLDDFMTDFDEERMITLVGALEGLGSQLIFTTPLAESALSHHLVMGGAQVVRLTG